MRTREQTQKILRAKMITAEIVDTVGAAVTALLVIFVVLVIAGVITAG